MKRTGRPLEVTRAFYGAITNASSRFSGIDFSLSRMVPDPAQTEVCLTELTQRTEYRARVRGKMRTPAGICVKVIEFPVNTSLAFWL